MNESTARAERYDLQTSPSSFYLWEVPQKPVAVRIPYELIHRLEREAVESFRSVTSRGSEIGGLLLGSVAAGNPSVVSIDEFQLIESEYARGPLYRLSDVELARFQSAIAERAGKGVGIAGFFRTHTRKGISLDRDDLAVLDAHFREPHHVALLVRPFATKASTAGIFIREAGKFSTDPSPLEFPFRAPGAEGRTAAEPIDAKGLTAIPAPPPKPTIRAQIVPIAPRRDLAPLPDVIEDRTGLAPVADVLAAPPTMPVVEEEKVEKQQSNLADASIAPATLPEKPAAKEPAPVERKAVERPAEPVADVPAEAAKSGKGLKLVLAALATTALFVILFVYPGVLNKVNKTAAPQAQDSSPLQLRVERTNGELLLTWNRESEAIRKASKAVLSITDGEQHENVEMDLAQLRNGSIVYSPQGSDISFKMEVTSQSHNKTTSESVRVLRTRPSPLQDQPSATPAAPKPNQPAQDASERTEAATGANTSIAADATTQEASRPVLPTKPFKAESLGQRLRATQSTDLPEAPAVAGTHVVSAAIPGVNVTGMAPAPVAPPSAPPAPATAAPEAKTLARSGGQIQQAVLITKKEPEYPKLARQTGAKGSVKLTATIGKDGRVKGVKVVSGHPMLQSAAKEAVLQWTYKPTLLNGQPVESDVEVVLNFLGQK